MEEEKKNKCPFKDVIKIYTENIEQEKINKCPFKDVIKIYIKNTQGDDKEKE